MRRRHPGEAACRQPAGVRRRRRRAEGTSTRRAQSWARLCRGSLPRSGGRAGPPSAQSSVANARSSVRVAVPASRGPRGRGAGAAGGGRRPAASAGPARPPRGPIPGPSPPGAEPPRPGPVGSVRQRARYVVKWEACQSTVQGGRVPPVSGVAVPRVGGSGAEHHQRTNADTASQRIPHSGTPADRQVVTVRGRSAPRRRDGTRHGSRGGGRGHSGEAVGTRPRVGTRAGPRDSPWPAR